MKVDMELMRCEIKDIKEGYSLSHPIHLDNFYKPLPATSITNGKNNLYDSCIERRKLSVFPLLPGRGIRAFLILSGTPFLFNDLSSMFWVFKDCRRGMDRIKLYRWRNRKVYK